MICDFGDIVVVPFPFIDMPVSKSRPALVVSGRSFNRRGNTVFAMITTAKGSSWPGDVTVTDLAGAGLVRGCYIRWKLFTLPNELPTRRLGTLGSQDMLRAQTALRTCFPATAPRPSSRP